MQLRPGQLLEAAMWLDGRETEEQLQDWRGRVAKALMDRADADNVMLAPPNFYTLKPGEDRVPQVPDHISGPNVRLLVCETIVLALRPVVAPKSFLSELDPRDLERLRRITRQAHRKNNPHGRLLSLAECDRIIEELGPESAARVVRAAVDTGTVH